MTKIQTAQQTININRENNTLQANKQQTMSIRSKQWKDTANESKYITNDGNTLQIIKHIHIF